MAELLIQPSLAGDPNAVALARLPERITDLDVSPLVIYDLDRVAAAALPYLAEQFNLVGPLWEHLQGEAAQREAIRRAIAWHRAKGTPWAITEALSWIGVTATPDDLRSLPTKWAAYELKMPAAPAPELVPLIIALAKFAAPARAHLVRLYNVEHDLRPLILDRGPALDAGMLDGYSGMPTDPSQGGVVLSFAERRGSTLQAAPIGTPTRAATEIRISVSRYDDMPVLDAWRLDSRVLSGISGGFMELSTHVSDAPQPGGGTLITAEIPTLSSAWEAPPPVGWRTEEAVGIAPVPVHPPRHWGGPWGGPWRDHFQLISYEEP